MIKGNILVIGCAGYIGSNLSSKLCSLGYTVFGIDNFFDSYSLDLKEKRIKKLEEFNRFYFQKIDASDYNSLKDYIDSLEELDYVINLAAPNSPIYSFSKPFDYFDTITKTTLNILECIKLKPIKKYIQGSSVAVYGGTRKYPFIEKSYYSKPLNPYGAFRLSSERLCEVYSKKYDFSTIVLRIFSTYGPDMQPNKFLYQVLDQIYTTGEVNNVFKPWSRDYIYISDVVNGILNTFDKRLSYQVINLCTGESLSNDSLVKILKDKTKKKFIVNYNKTPNTSVKDTLGSTVKAKKLLNFSSNISFEEGITKTIAWFSENIVKSKLNVKKV